MLPTPPRDDWLQNMSLNICLQKNQLLSWTAEKTIEQLAANFYKSCVISGLLAQGALNLLVGQRPTDQVTLFGGNMFAQKRPHQKLNAIQGPAVTPLANDEKGSATLDP